MTQPQSQQLAEAPRTVRFILRYLVDGYILADAFRPQPNWGARTFSIEADKLPTLSDEEIIKGARESAPAGYWLHSITAIEADPAGERNVFGLSVLLPHSERKAA